eukprot:SM000226S07405  [mRNA]  locus=s226:132596:136404:+ [translate_table: standard]
MQVLTCILTALFVLGVERLWPVMGPQAELLGRAASSLKIHPPGHRLQDPTELVINRLVERQAKRLGGRPHDPEIAPEFSEAVAEALAKIAADATPLVTKRMWLAAVNIVKQDREEAESAMRQLEKLTGPNDYSILPGTRLVESHTGWKSLDIEIEKKELTNIVLHRNYYMMDRSAEKPNPKENCEALECPNFGRCVRERQMVNGMCRNPELFESNWKGEPPLNKPPRAEDERVYQPDYEGNNFVMENVYINHKGQVFNATHHFMAGGCSASDHFHHTSATKVYQFKTLVNLISVTSKNFYHAVSESVIELVTVHPLLQAYPTIPVAFHIKQDVTEPLSEWLDVLGYPEGKLNAYYLAGSTGIFFAEKLIMPGRCLCGRPSGSVLKALRDQFLKIPMEPLEQSSGKKQPLGKIVFYRRESSLWRAVNQEATILAKLKKKYGQDKVVTFYGTEPLSELRAMLSYAVLLMGPHGAGLTNMVHMREGTSVLELRASNYVNVRYHYLADSVHMPFYMVAGAGDMRSAIDIDVSEVMSVVNMALPESWRAYYGTSGMR